MTKHHRQHSLAPPGPRQIANAPQLAALALLDAALQTSVNTLVAAHPELVDLERPYTLPPLGPLVRHAQAIVRLGHRLHEELAAYNAIGTVVGYATHSPSPDVLGDEADLPF